MHARRHARTLALLISTLAAAPALAAAPPSAGPPPPVTADDGKFDRLAEEYFAAWAAVHPTSATDLGLHQHDGALEDFSAAAMAREIARLRAARERFAAVDGAKLSGSRAVDLEIVRRQIAGDLVRLERVEGWRHHPSRYVNAASRSIDVLIKRAFAPPEERLRSVIAREERIPTLLAAGEHNLVPSAVAPVAIEIVTRDLDEVVGFFERDVTQAFENVTDEGLRARFRRSNAAAADALRHFGKFLAEMKPKASGKYAIGEAVYRDLLDATEMIDEPLPSLLSRGEAELRRLQQEFQATARRIDPKRPFRAVQADIGHDHPPPAGAIPFTQQRLAGLRAYLVEHGIVTVPSEVMPRVQETPPFLRSTTFASMETPGPFESKATEAFYYETLPEPSWPPAQIEEYMQGYSRPLVDVVSIHEAFPGHYVQFLWLPRVRSTVRKYVDFSSNSEGWAHYCEQMMLDQGWGAGKPEIRLAQLQDALLRAARFVVGIRLHTRGMTLEQATDYFVEEGYQTRKVAEVEVRRGTEDPTYLVYTYGKLEILKLRDELMHKLGAKFSLHQFHDDLLAEGAIPLPLLRRIMLAK